MVGDKPYVNRRHPVLWIAFDPVFGEDAVLNEVYTNDPGKWALRYRLDETQEPGVEPPAYDDRDAVIIAEAKREERERWAALRKAVEEHLVYNGPCEYADEGDALCDDSECTYCALSKALEAPDAQGE